MTLIKELKVKKKIKNIYLADLLFIFAFILFAWSMKGFVATIMQIPFIIFNFIVAVILIIPSKWNPGKKTWQAMLFSINKDRTLYKPITVNLRGDDFE